MRPIPWRDDRTTHHLRCTLVGALGAIGCVAVGCVALREASAAWDRGLSWLTLSLLLLAVVWAVRSSGGRRAFWVGFAVFGWGYLGLSLVPSIRQELVTTRALTWLHRSRAFDIPVRVEGMRIRPIPERMAALDLSTDDLMKALAPTTMLPVEPLGPLMGQVALADGSVAVWDAGHNEPRRYEEIILRANPEGEILRLKEVARIESGLTFEVPRVGVGTNDRFICIGQTLLALAIAVLGGLLTRWLSEGLRKKRGLACGPHGGEDRSIQVEFS